MASSSLSALDLDLAPAPDLRPLYPTPGAIAPLLAPGSGLAPAQRAELVAHCLLRACVFADISVLSLLLLDPHAQPHVDLAFQDEDGLGLHDIAILGFGADGDRDMEREECVRLLVSQGADLKQVDHAGWTPLHHAAMKAPTTLVSYFISRGCSPFALTRRGVTPLGLITGHSTLPGREDVAFLLQESMKSEGWTGGKVEERRKVVEHRRVERVQQRAMREEIGTALGINPGWWSRYNDDMDSDISDDEEEDEQGVQDDVFTPPIDYTSMLVFDSQSLPYILDSVISNYQPSVRDTAPANTLYMLARFAALTCDHTWLEDLVMCATDAIEETFFNQPDEISNLLFWLYNVTVWLHLMRCDESIREACELLGCFVLIEEVINSVFVFIIRFAERRVDQLLDAAILDYTPLPAEVDSVQFESEWSIFRSLVGKKKSSAVFTPAAKAAPAPSPLATVASPISPTSGFNTLRQNIARARAPTAGSASSTPLHALFPDAPPPPSPHDIIAFLTALHTMMVLSGINPALITQIWSQVMYWTACETFNRILTRKKYLCRSRALQVRMNVGALEDWVTGMGLPRGVDSHFAPVRELIDWLQRLSSITEFSSLIATIQNLKNLNPLQMRRAVRDYKYEVSETHMTDECSQYLAQLQKDWERHRIKLGVEALRREIDERERDRDDDSSVGYDGPEGPNYAPSISSELSVQCGAGIDVLFDRAHGKTVWEPIKPPQVLGELMDSRFMLPLLLPSDPRLLSAMPGVQPVEDPAARRLSTSSSASAASAEDDAGSLVQSQSVLAWRCRNKKLREVNLDSLRYVDGLGSAAHWVRHVEAEAGDFEDGDEDEPPPSYAPDDPQGEDDTVRREFLTPIAPMAMARRRSSGRGREASGGVDMDVDGDEDPATPTVLSPDTPTVVG